MDEDISTGSRVKKSFMRERMREVILLNRGTRTTTETKVSTIMPIDVPFR